MFRYVFDFRLDFLSRFAFYCDNYVSIIDKYAKIIIR